MATGVVNERVYVAVEADVQEGMMTLLWALQNLEGHFCILHVHNPYGTGSSGDPELQNMHMNLDDYVNICNQAEVPVEKQWIEATDTKKAIGEFISQHGVRKLVMGAAADEHYTKGMTELKSTKAIFVVEHAHPSCSIWFICKGQLIRSRKGDSGSTTSEDDLALVLFEGNQESGSRDSVPSHEEDLQLALLKSLERNSHEELYEKLKRAMADTEKAKREAYEELVSRQKTEKEAIEATKRAKIFEDHYSREVQRRKELEEMLSKEQERSEDNMQELNATQVKLQKCERDREDLQILLDNMLNVNDDEVLMNQAGEHPLNSPRKQLLMEFSPSELKEATNSFDPSSKTEDGDYWSSYKGTLRNTQVTVKRLHSDSRQSSSQYHLEVEVMSKLRHPNLVTLIGVCPDDYTLIYEYLPNGSLENQVSSSSSSAALLSWQTRIRISTEICASLNFLHSSEIVHGDLKSRNVLLDANFVSKLQHFGVHHQTSINEELSVESDVCSFGIIMLQLLTGRSDQDLAAEVQDALNEGNVSAVLDSAAGDWPFAEAMQLAELALNCCVADQRDRPDLRLEVWALLEKMREDSSSAASSSSSAAPPPSDHQAKEPPEYFICPISRDIMEDPHVAADGFTYEAETIREWLNSGHETSPMTNVELLHDYLTPNHSLRSAIQEWLQNH